MKPLSRDFLLNRGFCCKCGCRNCPYKIDEMIKLNNILLEVASGDCYQAAGRLMTSLSGDHTLVHGMVNGQGALEGKRFGHAWVETNDTVLDHSNGRKLEVPKDLYYAIGGVRKEDNKYYNKDESLKWILKAKHWGPWEMSGDTVSMYEDIPTDQKELGKEEIPVDKADMTKLMPMLKEIGDGSAKAFPWQYKESHPASDDQDFTYIFQGDKGQGIVTFVFGDHNEWDVAFGSVQPRSPIDSTEEGDFSTLTDEGPFRVMATVTEIIKDFLSKTYKKHIDDKGLFGKTEPKELSFNTTKEPGRGKKGTSKRAKLYQAYIQKQLPGASVRKFIAGNNTDGYIITLP